MAFPLKAFTIIQTETWENQIEQIEQQCLADWNALIYKQQSLTNWDILITEPEQQEFASPLPRRQEHQVTSAKSLGPEVLILTVLLLNELK